MAISIIKQPDEITPLFSNLNRWVMSRTSETQVTIIITIGGNNYTYEPYFDNNGICEFDVRYILSNYADLSFPELTLEPFLTYSISIDGSNQGTFKTFLGTWQVTQGDYIKPTVISRLPKRIKLFSGDELKYQSIENDGVRTHTINTNSNSSFTVDGTLVKVIVSDNDTRFPNYRFRYINKLGGVDYVNFSLRNSEFLKIKRFSYVNNSRNNIYDTIEDKEISVISDYMTEEESLNLSDFWGSPKVEVFYNGMWLSVILHSDKVSLLKYKEGGLIGYKVSFEFADVINTQY